MWLGTFFLVVLPMFDSKCGYITFEVRHVFMDLWKVIGYKTLRWRCLHCSAAPNLETDAVGSRPIQVSVCREGTSKNKK